MDLPAPTFSFSIPSIHDGINLECRVYLPNELQNIQSTPTPTPTPVTSRWKPRGAILAHPYTRLGGCYDDPVVSFVGGELLQAGYLVGTFNFRGAGGSEGQTSWTAKSELEDYVSFYGFMLVYLQQLKNASALIGGNPTGQTPDSSALPGEGYSDIQLILGGYSFGSLIASHAPDVDVILELFRSDTNTDPSTPVNKIGRVARKIAAASASTRHLYPSNRDVLVGPDTDTGTGTADDSQPRASPPISIAYLLVSPLLPPVSHFLTCFSNLSLNVGVREGQGRLVQTRPDHQLSTHSSLALYGDEDTFTSASKLQRWSAEIARVPQSRFQSGEIGGAGHFWREDGVEARARNRLREWLRLIESDQI
ncbi:hypothetical protein N7481_010488 [Penicillium waksmanii]|uniref:uncharacterized protein n=1 Tax=Penicillium waksmanii TaxID=69791 RepID=UPI002548D7B8|nr:uncharacterized protein N7481_010488 [Penicillium waksmanii]KAJ5973278.1 hypothetical protein N7481_010488 [Penicillium waksmanii]